jgi:hypothetical protein
MQQFLNKLSISFYFESINQDASGGSIGSKVLTILPWSLNVSSVQKRSFRYLIARERMNEYNIEVS